VSSDIPQWVRLACAKWGRQKRRVWLGRDWHGNIDGYAQSLLGRIRDERDGASQGVRSQRWPEVFWGDGLAVQRKLNPMPERQFYAIHFQYVWDPDWNVTANRKARYMEVGRTEYFELVDRAETWVHASLEVEPDSQLTDAVQKIVRKALQTPVVSITNCQAGRNIPALNLEALGRTPLKLKL
jgi:hypothetical protein